MGIEHDKLNWCGWGLAAQTCEDPGEEAWGWLADEMGMPTLLATPALPRAQVKLPPSALSTADIRMLCAVVGAENVRSDDDARLSHAGGRSSIDLLRLRSGEFPRLPDAVVMPRSAIDVMMLLKLCEALHIAAFPLGGGSSLRRVPVRSGFNAVIGLDLSRLDRVIMIDPDSCTAAAEAGIAGPALEAALAERGLTLGHKPLSFEFSTLGGWIAEDSIGLESGRYGRVRDWLIGARLAAPAGWLPGRFAVGARGACGIVTEAAFRVRPLPQTHENESWAFPDFAAALAAARTAQRQDAKPSALRIADTEATRMAPGLRALARPTAALAVSRRHPDDGGAEPGAALAHVGFAGDTAVVARARTQFSSIARGCGGRKSREPPMAKTETPFALPYVRDMLLDRGVGVGLFRAEADWRQLPGLHRRVCDALDAAMRETAPRQGARGRAFGYLLHAAPEGAVLGFLALYPRALGADIAQAEAIERAAAATIGADPALPEVIVRALDPAAILQND